MAGGERRGNEVCGVKRVKKLVGTSPTRRCDILARDEKT